jgi:glycosyltransferase involved in cell wall biosynthesis
MSALERTRVCMFVRNSFEFDARVEREATTLAAEGAAVTVVALWDPDRTSRSESRGPIAIRRVRRFFWFIDALRGAWIRRSRPEGGGPSETTAIGAGLDAMQRTWTKARRVGVVGRLRDAMIALRMAAVGLRVRADVYHAHDLNTLAAASWCARARSARLVYDSHEIAPGQENIAHPAATAERERGLIHRADAVIHTTPMRAEWAATTYGIATPKVILNVPDVEGRVEPLDLSIALGFPPETNVIVHPGGLQPNRGLEALIEATSELDESFGLAFVGHGRHRPVLERMVAERGLGPRVRFHGPVPHRELLRYVAGGWCGASLLVDTCLNHRFSLPNKLFECMVAGVPIVVSDNPEIARFVSDWGIGEVCEPTDGASVAAAVGRLEKRYGEAKENVERSAGNFAWQNEARKLIDLYTELVGR